MESKKKVGEEKAKRGGKLRVKEKTQGYSNLDHFLSFIGAGSPSQSGIWQPSIHLKIRKGKQNW